MEGQPTDHMNHPEEVAHSRWEVERILLISLGFACEWQMTRLLICGWQCHQFLTALRAKGSVVTPAIAAAPAADVALFLPENAVDLTEGRAIAETLNREERTIPQR